MNRKSLTRALALLLVVGGFVLASCTPEQQAAFQAHLDWQKANDRFAGAISEVFSSTVSTPASSGIRV